MTRRYLVNRPVPFTRSRLVVKALRTNLLDVVAIHHMTGGRPVVIFLHYWGRGPAATLERGVRAALDATRARRYRQLM